MTDDPAPGGHRTVRSLLADIVQAWNDGARRAHETQLAAQNALVRGGDAWRPPDPRYPSVTCPVCGATSYSRGDIDDGYCGNCHRRTSPPGGNNPVPVS